MAAPKILKGRERDDSIRQALDKVLDAEFELGKSLFYHPAKFEDRLYSKAEVMGILSKYGHKSVIVKAETFNITGKYLKTILLPAAGNPWGSG